MIDERERFEEAFALFERPEPAWERLVRRRDRKRRNQRIVAGVVGIAVFVAAIWIVTSDWSSDRTQRPTNELSTVNPTDAVEDVVRGFLGAAFGAFDPEAAMTYVADDADLRGLIEPPAPANKKSLSLMLALFEVAGYQQTITSCHATPLSSGTHVVCGFVFTTIDAEELGRGPFTGSTFVFVVRDGRIAIANGNWNLDQYASQVRAPFAEWLAATYPRDFEVMYGSIPPRPAGFREVHYRLTEESIRLFRLRTREYVKAVKQGTT
jgi:hypothetical protein